MVEKAWPYCCDTRVCFGQNKKHECTVLTETYPTDKCPFCKPKRTVTDGKEYPWNSMYGSKD